MFFLTAIKRRRGRNRAGIEHLFDSAAMRRDIVVYTDRTVISLKGRNLYPQIAGPLRIWIRPATVAAMIVAAMRVTAVPAFAANAATRPAVVAPPAGKNAAGLPNRAIKPANAAGAADEKAQSAWDRLIAQRRSVRDHAEGGLRSAHDGGSRPMRDLLTLALVDGHFSTTVANFPRSEPTRVEVAGSPAGWLVTRTTGKRIVGNARVPVPMTTTSLQRIERGVKSDDEVYSTAITVNDCVISFIAHSVRQTVMLSQNTLNHDQLMAVVYSYEAPPKTSLRFKANANSLPLLKSAHPEEFREYLQPLLERMSGQRWLRPGAADYYNVFSTLQADPAVTQQIEALLPALDSFDFAVRDAASAKLAAIGTPAVLAALRMDRSQLTGEQRGRLGEFVANHCGIEPVDPSVAVKDPYFLADALEDDDPAVRAAAKSALAEAFGKPVDIDIGSIGADHTNAVEALRKSLTEPAFPDTQPLQN